MIAGLWVLAGLSISGMLLTWLIYPMTVRLLAARRGDRPAGDGAAAPPVSVILVTQAPEGEVRARLANLLESSYPADRIEIVVCADGAPYGGFPEAEREGARIRLTTAPHPGGKASGLNAAVAEARHEILVFTDTHQRFRPDAIARLVGTLTAGPWSIVSGALEIEGAGQRQNLLTRYWSWERRLREAEARVASTVGVTGAIYAMWRRDWSRLPPGLILDDLYVPMRGVLAGRRVGFEPAAIASDVRTTRPAQEFRRKVRTLTGNLQLCAWLPQVLNPARNPIWLQFVCHKLLRLLTPYFLAAGVVAGVGLLLLLAPAAGLPVLFGGVLALLLLLLSRRLRSVLIWGLAMQAAAVVAALNGIRGRWDVWHPAPPAPDGHP